MKDKVRMKESTLMIRVNDIVESDAFSRGSVMVSEEMDETRVPLQFIVIETGMAPDGESSQHRYRRFVRAKSISKPDEIICFYLAGRSDISIDVRDVRIIRRG